ncbi:MAG: dephospho-CoA kinase [Bacillota bacterium]
MKVIGLTGGIASGKTTVASILDRLGARVIDADLIAKEIVEPGKPALQDIIKYFGKDVLLPDGRLNREYLGDLIFGNPEDREKINSITHPRIIKEVEDRLEKCRQEGIKVVILDVPLLLETGMDDMVDEVWLAAVDEMTQVKRIIARDKLSKEQAMQRIASQMPLKEKIKRADKVIDTGCSKSSLETRVKKLYFNLLV